MIRIARIRRPRAARRLAAAVALASLASPISAQEAPEAIEVFFGLGETAVAAPETAKLDQAARLFREGQPIVMIVAGGADTTGPAELNLAVSAERARTVLDGLAARGIPVERLQLVARGQSELAVPTEDEVDEPRNRVVEITWR